MRTASIRELQHGMKGLLKKVQAGETVQVTRRGEVVAHIIPTPHKRNSAKPPQWPDFMARLEKIFPDGVPPGKLASEIVDEGRGERP